MKTRTKVLLLTLCAALLVCATVLATMAFLTDTAEVKNTFTVGNVDITLDEAKVTVYGKADGTAACGQKRRIHRRRSAGKEHMDGGCLRRRRGAC